MTIQTVGPGRLVGWSPLLAQAPMTATARAVLPCRLIALNALQVLEACARNPSFGVEFMRRTALALSRRLQATRRQLLEAVEGELPVMSFMGLGGKQFSDAVAALSEAVTLEPEVAAFHADRALAHHAQGNYDLAIDDFTKAIKLEPKEANHYLNRAKSHEKKGNKKKAQRDRAKAARLAGKLASDLQEPRPPSPLVNLTTVPREVEVRAGQKVSFLVQVTRQNAEGGVTVCFEGLPPGITLTPPSFDTHTTEEQVLVTADGRMREGEYPVAVRGTCGSATAACDMTFRVISS
jgi:tetratricopeptide (TPR) repeat protein